MILWDDPFLLPENQLGSIFTAGVQNLFDLREYKSSNLPDGLPAKYQWAQGGTNVRTI